MPHVPGRMSTTSRVSKLCATQSRLDSLGTALQIMLPLIPHQVCSYHDLFAHALQSAPRVVGGDRATLLLLSKEHRVQWELESSQVQVGKPARGTFKVFGGDFLADMVETKQLVHIPHVSDCDLYVSGTHDLPNYSTLSLLAFPLADEIFGQTTAVLVVRKTHNTDVVPLNQEDGELLRAFGGLLAEGVVLSKGRHPTQWSKFQEEVLGAQSREAE
eukprot:TRINITY_DN18575_c0_g1_i1.p1 TRINITY_DN18575_c0_g1~~TRINITY_DN18575_c0_g1_i1.p1  ORF type:complete len:216 (+),score=55.23 TRINITY_DN18575_c0_g1_i1:18-665(+)